MGTGRNNKNDKKWEWVLDATARNDAQTNIQRTQSLVLAQTPSRPHQPGSQQQELARRLSGAQASKEGTRRTALDKIRIWTAKLPTQTQTGAVQIPAAAAGNIQTQIPDWLQTVARAVREQSAVLEAQEWGIEMRCRAEELHAARTETLARWNDAD